MMPFKKLFNNQEFSTFLMFVPRSLRASSEFFLKLTNEYLNVLEGSSYDLEIRGGAFIVRAFSLGSKLERGLAYRIDSFLNEASRSRYWIGSNYYLTI